MVNINFELIKVLVVEDNETTQHMLLEFLKRIGCVTACVKNGEEAVEILKTYNFDLCFMDLFMPKVGGVDAAQVIREDLEDDLPIIALTASGMRVDREKCLAVGMQDFMQKPVTLEMIEQMVRTYGIKNVAEKSTMSEK